MYAKIRNTEIYFDVAGMQWVPTKKGLIEKPVLFLLHGGPGSDHLAFKKNSLALQKYAQLIFIDHRGCGRSKKTKASDYTLENNIEDVEALRKHLGLEIIYLLGTSYGGHVAQGYAIRYPNRVKKLILVATSPSYRFIEEAKNTLQQRGDKEQIDLAEHLWNGTFKNHQHVLKYLKAMAPLYSTKTKRKTLAGKKGAIWSHEALNYGFKHFLRHFDFIPHLKKIKCPTLVLAGDRDWICAAHTQAKTIAKHIPHAQLKIFKNCGHSVAIDAQNRYINAIKHFIKKG